MLTLASLAVSLLLQAPLQVPPAPQAAPPPAKGTFLASLRDRSDPVVPGSLRARIEAARAAAAPAARAPGLHEERLLRLLRPAPIDDLGSAGRGAFLGRRGYAPAGDLRLGSAGRRLFLSRPPVFRSGARR